MEVKDNIHGNLEASPNAMYKNYSKWFMQKYGDRQSPMPFKAWLKWANSKGMVKNYSADAAPTPQDVMNAVKESHSMGKKFAIISLLLGLTGLIINIARK